MCCGESRAQTRNFLDPGSPLRAELLREDPDDVAPRPLRLGTRPRRGAGPATLDVLAEAGVPVEEVGGDAGELGDAAEAHRHVSPIGLPQGFVNTLFGVFAAALGGHHESGWPGHLTRFRRGANPRRGST